MIITNGDGSVSKERLIHLIGLDTEYDDLDFKKEWDTQLFHKQKVIITFAAMSSNKNGGYVVVGRSDDGDLCGISEDQLKGNPFDSSRLNKLYEQYTGNNGIASAVHEIEGKKFAIIYIPRSPEFFSVMLKDSEKFSSSQHLFKKGDVFIRKGTSCEKWDKIVANEIVEKIRKEAQTEALDSYAKAFKGVLQSNRISLDSSKFLQFSSEHQFLMLEDSKEISSILTYGKVLSSRLFIENQSDLELEENRRAFLNIASYLMLNDKKSFCEILEKVANTYQIKFSADSLSLDDSRIALSIAIAMQSLGALAVRTDEFETVRNIVNVPVIIADYYRYSSWLRHAQVMASRNHISVTVIRPNEKKSNVVFSPLIHGAIEETKNVTGLRYGYRSELEYERGKEKLLDSICSFDFLWCLIAFTEGSDSDYFPGFIVFSEDRILLEISMLVKSPLFRKDLLNNDSLDAFREKSLQLIEDSTNIRFTFDGFNGFTSRYHKIIELLKK